MSQRVNYKFEFTLLALLAFLWGSSYLLIKIAVNDIPPITLIAVRVSCAALFLVPLLYLNKVLLPRDINTWRSLFVQAIFNSIGAWTVLAWGQQFVDSGVASVLNSTSPIFVFILTALIFQHEALHIRKLFGALLGLAGVVLIVGADLAGGIGKQFGGNLACLLGAMLYACAAIYGKRFTSLGSVVTSAGTMICAASVMVPAALVIDQPWTLQPSSQSVVATLVLSIACTGVAFLIYFRLINTLGSMGVASQAYLRAGMGVLLGMIFLGETFTLSIALGLTAAISGVVLINWPTKKEEYQ